ncbi:MAG: trypsin-like serine protease [Clostridiales bacterium]|nr:trypsin-like serine protease [Clostridiales bacterium]
MTNENNANPNLNENESSRQTADDGARSAAENEQPADAGQEQPQAQQQQPQVQQQGQTRPQQAQNPYGANYSSSYAYVYSQNARPAAQSQQGYAGQQNAYTNPQQASYGNAQQTAYGNAQQQTGYGQPQNQQTVYGAGNFSDYDPQTGTYGYTRSNPAAAMTNEPVYGAPGNVKYKKPGIGKGAIALLVCSCIIFSFIFGALGASLVIGTKGDSGLIPSISESGSAEGGTTVHTTIGAVENTGLLDTENAVVNAIGASYDSVVEIFTESVTTSKFFGNYITEGAGSGVVISKDGYIITCAHVIDGATTVTVTMTDGRKLEAQIIGSDTMTDIAVIKVEDDNLKPAVIGNSDSLVIGSTAIAIGNPLGELGGTATTGIISALDREVIIEGENYSLLQTNAAINPGNSGGGLFNINGELIGIVNAKSAGSEIEGLGFAIPINDAIEIANQLITNGYIKGRVMLGVYISEVTSATSSYSLYSQGLGNLVDYITDYGIYFVEYMDNQTGDLQFGDRIVAIDGVTVSSKSDITALLKEYDVGDTVTITVARITNRDSRTPQSKMVEVSLTLLENIPAEAPKG